MLKKTFSLSIFLLLILPIFPVVAQKVEGPISVERIEEALKEGSLPLGRIAAIVREGGVNFELTAEVRERLKRAGADVVVLQAVERAAVEYAKRKVEEEGKKAEEERRKVEEEKKRIEAAKRREEEKRRAEEEANRKAEKEKKKKGRDEAEMVLIPAGEFWMGSEDGRSDEKPRRRVYLDAFSIDKYKVTNELYRRFMEATGQAAPGYWGNSTFNAPTQPVVGVNWQNAEAYCRWAGKRLPTEGEWEKAARGTDGRKYPWGEQWDSSRANSSESKLGKTAAVGSYPTGISPYGVHDMAGNVWEWVADWYGENYYQRSPDRNPKGPESGSYRVLRGGSWDGSSWYQRTSVRNGTAPTNRATAAGFRCAQ